MRFVLDANEYIFALGLFKKESCESLLQYFIENASTHSISICRTIIDEVRPNLTPKDFQTFVKFINLFASIDEDFLVPFEIGARYEAKGFKEADALIAAYAEWVGAEVLVSENRHFLIRNPNLPFKVLNADNCLKFVQASLQ